MIVRYLRFLRHYEMESNENEIVIYLLKIAEYILLLLFKTLILILLGVKKDLHFTKFVH